MQAASRDNQWSENRSHVSYVPYMLPNFNEIDRPDLQHYMLRYLLKGNYLAPIAKPAHILDVGSGTGRWVIEMAEEFPQAESNGIDLNIPEARAVPFPYNSHFHADNVLNGLPFEDNFFDFVHQRHMIFAIPQIKWQQLVNELVRVTRRGGWN